MYILKKQCKYCIIDISKIIAAYIIFTKGGEGMDLHRYDVIKAELKIKMPSGSVQNKIRPYVIVGNEFGTSNATIITVMPLTHVIKKLHMPVHGCLDVESDNGLSVYSMVLGEQPQTIDKKEVIEKLGTVTNKTQRNIINRVCYNSFFYGENINWKEVLA